MVGSNTLRKNWFHRELPYLLQGPQRRPNQGTLRLPKGLLFGVQVPSDPVQGTLGRGGHRTLGPIGTRGR